MRPPGTARPRGRRHRKRGPVASLGAARDDGQARLSFELYIARHGETEWSANGRHTGLTDLPLTARGEEKARELQPRLASIHFDAVFSSPLQRARRTAELAGYAEPRLTALLREVDYGDYEGMTSSQIHATNPSWEVYADGCPGGENPSEIYVRAQAFIAEATEAGARVLAFAHGHILRAIGAAFIHADLEVAAGLMLDVATLSVMRDDGRRMIVLWNSR